MARPQITRNCEQCGQSFTRDRRRDKRFRLFQRYCSTTCRTLARARPLYERLQAKLHKPSDTDACWTWTGPINNKGYGLIGRGGRNTGKILVHRAAWEQANGPILNGLHVCHRCDVPTCCNPSHLFLGTQTENMQDASRKGRTHHGERTPNAKLTEQHVREIRAATDTHQAIADRFGVSRSNVSLIRSRTHWKHVT